MFKVSREAEGQDFLTHQLSSKSYDAWSQKCLQFTDHVAKNLLVYNTFLNLISLIRKFLISRKVLKSHLDAKILLHHGHEHRWMSR